MRGAKSENSALFKDFCNKAEMEKNRLIGGIYFFIVPYLRSKSTGAQVIQK
jgi:hypothetical protein